MVQTKIKGFYDEDLFTKEKPVVVGEKRFKKRIRNDKPDWTIYQADNATDFEAPSYYFFQAYNKHENLRALPTFKGDKTETRSGVNIGTKQRFTDLSDLVATDEPVGFTTFAGSGGKAGSTTTYLLYCTRLDLVQAARNLGKRMNLRTLPEADLPETIDQDYNIRSRQISMGNVPDLSSSISLDEAFRRINRHDIQKFCGKNVADDRSEKTGFATVEKLVNSPSLIQIKTIEPNKFQMVFPGKGEFESHQICAYQIGIDLSSGCFVGMTVDGVYAPDNKCYYCYATNQNGADALQTIFEFDHSSLQERVFDMARQLRIADSAPLVIRLGQRVEMSMPRVIMEKFGLDNKLDTVLETLINIQKERKIYVAMPTKVPDFTKKTIDLLKKANVTVLVSYAYESLEPGVVGFGYTDRRRIELEGQLDSEGVNVHSFVATDIGRSMEAMQPGAKMVAEWHYAMGERVNAKLQYLEARIKRWQDAPLMGGAPRNVLIDPHHPMRVHFEELGVWGKTGLHALYPLNVHPDFLNVVGKAKGWKKSGSDRLCRTTGTKDDHHCGYCFMPDSRNLQGYPYYQGKNVISLRQI